MHVSVKVNFEDVFGKINFWIFWVCFLLYLKVSLLSLILKGFKSTIWIGHKFKYFSTVLSLSTIKIKTDGEKVRLLIKNKISRNLKGRRQGMKCITIKIYSTLTYSNIITFYLQCKSRELKKVQFLMFANKDVWVERCKRLFFHAPLDWEKYFTVE